MFASHDSFLDMKAIGAMTVRLPEWWTPDNPHTRDEIIERYSSYALKIVT